MRIHKRIKVNTCAICLIFVNLFFRKKCAFFKYVFDEYFGRNISYLHILDNFNPKNMYFDTTYIFSPYFDEKPLNISQYYPFFTTFCTNFTCKIFLVGWQIVTLYFSESTMDTYTGSVIYSQTQDFKNSRLLKIL